MVAAAAVYMQAEVDDAQIKMESDTQLCISDSLSTRPSSADIFPCSSRNIESSNSLACFSSELFFSRDSTLVEVDGRTTEDCQMQQETEESDWFSCKQDITDDLGLLHDGLDVVDIDDCAPALAGESTCRTIDVDAIIELSLNDTDIMTDIGRDSCGQSSSVDEREVVSGQLCFNGNTYELAGDGLLSHVDSAQVKGALNTASDFGFNFGGVRLDTLSTKAATVKPTRVSADVPCCVASNMPYLSSALKCEQATSSFLTPKTPTQSQGLPTYATHFSFSCADALQSSSPVQLSRPKTPVVSVSLPVAGHPQLSPHTPYTPDTPGVFQFPSPNQSPAASSGCSPATSRQSKRHIANYHPYSSPSAGTSSPRFLNQHQQALAQHLEQRKRLEQDVADSEIDAYVRQLQQADLQRSQQQLTGGVCRDKMSSKLSVTVPPETEVVMDTNNSDSTNTYSAPAVSPIEEVIQILVSKNFGVTFPSKFLQDAVSRTVGGSIVNVELTNNQLVRTGDTTTQQPADEKFRNPVTVPTTKPRKHKPEPLVIPACVSNFGFRSQLRSPKLWESCGSGVVLQGRTSTPPPYTPPPMISPARAGSGVFWTLHGSRQLPTAPLSAPPCHMSFTGIYDTLLH